MSFELFKTRLTFSPDKLSGWRGKGEVVKDTTGGF